MRFRRRMGGSSVSDKLFRAIYQNRPIIASGFTGGRWMDYDTGADSIVIDPVARDGDTDVLSQVIRDQPDSIIVAGRGCRLPGYVAFLGVRGDGERVFNLVRMA